MSSPQQPWERRCWRNGICRPDLGGKLVMLWIMALSFGGVAAGIVWKAPEMRAGWAVLFPVFFGGVGAAFLVAALISTTRWFRFGRCVLHLQTFPGVIGGYLRGELMLPSGISPETDVRLELFCETRTTTPSRRSDDRDTTSVTRNWTHTLRVNAAQACPREGGLAVPFNFTVPYGLPDATASGLTGRSRVDVAWQLRAFAKIPGPDLELTFQVPVFATGASDPAVKDAPAHAHKLDALLRDRGERRRVHFEFVDGANVYVCDGQGRKAGAQVIVPVLIGTAFLGGAVLVACNALPFTVGELCKQASGWGLLLKLVPLLLTGGALFMVVVVGGLGLLLLTLGLRSFVTRRTWVQNGAVLQRCRLFGVTWRRRVPCREVTGVDIGGTSSSGGLTWRDVTIRRQPAGQTRRSDLRALFHQLTVATDIATQQEADELMTRLRLELRLPERVEDAEG